MTERTRAGTSDKEPRAAPSAVATHSLLLPPRPQRPQHRNLRDELQPVSVVAPAVSVAPNKTSTAKTGRTFIVIAVACSIAIALAAILEHSKNSEPTNEGSKSRKADGTQPAKEREQSNAATTPCTRARDSALGAPLLAAIRRVNDAGPRPTDNDFYDEAVSQAREAVRIDPACAAAWSVLGYALYRRNYEICGSGNYVEAERAASKAAEIAGSDVATRAAALRNLGRIASARNEWDSAEARFEEALKLDPNNPDAADWIAQLSVRKMVRPQLLAAVEKALEGRLVTEPDVVGLTRDEVDVFLVPAPLARNGRRLNTGPVDWLFYCQSGPLGGRLNVDPAVGRSPIERGSIDARNRTFFKRLEQRLRMSESIGNSK